MTIMHPLLLSEIDAFLAETGMGESYFGKAAAGNSELVSRLRGGKRIWPETEAKVRSFILSRRAASSKKDVSDRKQSKGKVSHTATISGAAQ